MNQHETIAQSNANQTNHGKNITGFIWNYHALLKGVNFIKERLVRFSKSFLNDIPNQIDRLNQFKNQDSIVVEIAPAAPTVNTFITLLNTIFNETYAVFKEFGLKHSDSTQN